MRGFRLNLIAAATLAMGLLTSSSHAIAQSAGDDIDVDLTADAGRCHCPCIISCGGGLVNCDCTMHEQTCRKCNCASAGISTRSLDLAAKLGHPRLELRFAPWFETEPYEEIEVAVEATMLDSGLEEAWTSRWVQDPVSPWSYVPDSSFDRAAFAAWVARVAPGKQGRLYAAVKDDPGTYRIVDGDLRHLSESMEKSMSLALGRGVTVPVFRSDSTLGWEMTTYLRQTAAGLDPSAFSMDVHDARAGMLGRVDSIDLQIKGGDFEGAIATLDDLIRQAEGRWLWKDNPHAQSAICAFGKMRNLLAPGTMTCD